jgi:hypothetical protein
MQFQAIPTRNVTGCDHTCRNVCKFYMKCSCKATFTNITTILNFVFTCEEFNVDRVYV